jgi:3-oxosteroid 1-dehydrogenase
VSDIIQDYDFVVVGSGGALVAAIIAKARGLRPLVIEKEPFVGGSTALSGGIIWVPNNPVMKRDGAEDSEEAALQYMENFTEGLGLISTRERRLAYIRGGGEMVDFLEQQGMKWEYCREYADYYSYLPGGHQLGRSLQADLFDLNELGAWKEKFRINPAAMPVRTSEGRHLFLMKRTMKGAEMATRLAGRIAKQTATGSKVVGSGGALQGRILQIALKAGVDIWVNAAMSGFIVEDGRVVGLRVVRDGRELSVAAPNGVLMGTGGFARNLEMRQKLLPQPTSTEWTKANPGDTGEGIEMMVEAGAGVGGLDQAWWIPTSIPPNADPIHNVADLAKPHGILVDAAGARFADEGASYMEIGKRMYDRHPTASTVPSWYVMDARHRNNYPWFRTPPGVNPPEWLSSGWMKRANTLEELAQQCGVDPAGLKATAERFTGFAKAGKDLDYRRGESAYARYFGDPKVKPNPCLGGIEQAPFYAIPIWPGDGSTMGGVLIDEHARVLRPDGAPIEGLYATGNAAASLVGPNYAGAGYAIGSSCVFGYIAAQHAAERTPAAKTPASSAAS